MGEYRVKKIIDNLEGKFCKIGDVVHLRDKVAQTYLDKGYIEKVEDNQKPKTSTKVK